jgi:hypothetical protein
MLAIGVAGTAASSIGQMNAQKKQEAAYNEWAQQQEKARQMENVRQEGMRKTAEEAREIGLEKVSADSQKNLQAEEAARLAAEMEGQGQTQASADPAATTSVADKALSGSAGGGEVFQSDLAQKLSNAAKSAKQRIGALATANSFGDSWGGLGTVNPLNLQESGRKIDEQNAYRKGSLGAYSAEQAIDPQQISYSNPIADIAASFLGPALGQIGGGAAGGGLGKMFSGALGKGATSTMFPAAPVSSFIGPSLPVPKGFGAGLF